MNTTYRIDLPELVEMNPEYSSRSLYKLKFWSNLDELDKKLKLEHARIRLRPTNNYFNVVIENCTLPSTYKIWNVLQKTIYNGEIIVPGNLCKF